MSIWLLKDKGVNFQVCISEKENETKDMTKTYRKTSASNLGHKEEENTKINTFNWQL